MHFWKCGKDFVSSVKEMIAAGEKYNNEFYIAPTYNYLIKDGKKILPFFSIYLCACTCSNKRSNFDRFTVFITFKLLNLEQLIQ